MFNRNFAILINLNNIKAEHSTKPNLWYINYYAFFMSWPILDVIGFSVTFYFFLFLLFFKGSVIIEALNTNFPLRPFFFLFLVGAFISTFTAPPLPRPPPIMNDVRLMVQHVYWVVMAAFFVIFGKNLNILELSKYIFYGLISALFFFYLPFAIKFSSGLFGINTQPNRNGVLYTLLALIPFSFYYIHKTWGRRGAILFLIIFNMCVIATEGRSGTIVFFIETIFIVQILFPFSKTLFKVLLIVFGLFSLISDSDIVKPTLMRFASVVETVNPRLANLIRGEKDGDLTQDRSWLFRLVQVEKAQEIIAVHPLFGIGLGHFSCWDGTLRLFYMEQRLRMKLDPAEVNKGSAHNSYYMILAETGFFGFVCVFFLVFISVFRLIYRVGVNSDLNYSDLASAGLLGISIHWYTIASFMGGVTWLAIAFAIWSRKIKY